MQIYQSNGQSVDNNVIRNNYVHDTSGAWMAANRPGCITNNSGNTDTGKGQGILVRGSNNRIYNNVVTNIDSSPRPCGVGCGAIMLYGWGSNNQVHHNTVYNITAADGIQVGSGVKGAVVRNNIVHQASGGIRNYASDAVVSHNLMTDPRFISASSLDFHLRSDSPAIDTAAVVSGIDSDFDGAARPQGSSSDVGAYERGSSSSLPTAPVALRIVQ
jgi:serralysin